MEILFRKYHTENADYLVLDPEHTKFDLLAQNIRIVCDRTKGLGADYLLCGPHYDGEHTISTALPQRAHRRRYPNP